MMIRKLQNKFIVISMLSMLLVLTVIIGSINILNYRQLIEDADHILHILSENDGEFPKDRPRPDSREPQGDNSSPDFKDGLVDNASPDPREPQGNNSSTPKKPKLHSMDMSPEMPFETRYFSVVLTENGNVSSTNVQKVAAIDNEDANAYALRAWKRQQTSGFLSSYRYLMEHTPEGTRIIFVDCTRNLSTFRAFLFTSILVSILGLLSVFVLVLFFSRLVMKPVAESYEKQRQFITDAGHEIKTPLAIIEANRELLEMEYGENEWNNSIQRQTARLADLTDGLIYLSRMEEAEKHLQHMDFSISALAEETAQSFQTLADLQDRHFSVEIEPLLSYCGDESSIHRLFSILIDNAIKYSPPQGTVKVTLNKRGKNIQFMVYNTVAHLSAESLPFLFDRFYRADSSRNSETGGYGIGLSIARAITDAHKGKISAKSTDGQSLLITVIL
jgi:signal transduction histidine kinase